MNLNNKFIYSIVTMLTRAWSLTLKYTRVNYEPVLKLRRKKSPIIFAIYHGEMFPLCCLHANEEITVVVSRSRDGELIASVLKMMGYNLARGSSSREGLRALRSAARHIKNSNGEVVFTVDGPRGPRHVAKAGIIYLASRSRAYIVPVRVGMRTRHVFKSWDRFSLPWLWSGCRIIYGTPYKIPSKLNSQKIQEFTSLLDQKLQSLL
ncbi:MAG: lysophospholipid acyltransferase family protein [Desulfonatronovibrio sp.]